MKKLWIGIIVFIGVASLAGVIAYGVHTYRLQSRTYETYDITDSRTLSGISVSGYLDTEDGILRYTRDGASVTDGTLTEVWNISYNFSNPIADTCGHYTVLSDKEATTLYIVAGDGDYTKITTEYSIEKCVVASQGVTAVWMDDGEQDYITVYDADGNILCDLKTLTNVSGFPVDMAISEDGTKLVTDFVDFEDETMVSEITFYNFDEVGENYQDKLVGQYLYKETLCADVRFLGNDTVVVFGTDGFRLFQMEEIPVVTAEVAVAETISLVACSEDYVGLLVESEKDSGSMVRIYNTEGVLKEEREISGSYSHFQIENDCLLIYNDTQLNVYRIDGNTKIETELDKSADYIREADEQSRFLIEGEAYAEIIRLIGEAEEEQ